MGAVFSHLCILCVVGGALVVYAADVIGSVHVGVWVLSSVIYSFMCVC